MLENFPGLNKNANTVIEISIGSPSGPDHRDNGYVALQIRDDTSGEVFVDVEMDPGRFYRLLQGGVQHWPAFISPNLDRVGKRMENKRVLIPKPLEGDTNRDEARDVAKAVVAQLPEDWHYAYDSYDTPRRTNKGPELEVIVRRWRAVETEGQGDQS